MFFIFFFNYTATTEIYTLSLHDALPISEQLQRPCRSLLRPGRHRRSRGRLSHRGPPRHPQPGDHGTELRQEGDRKSTRLNSSHVEISYAVFCLKKKKKILAF